MGYLKRATLVAVAAVVVIGAPAEAAEVIVVDGDRARRIQDPAVPTQAEVALGMPVGDRGPSGPRAGAARADVARSSTRPDARAARAWRVARSSSRRGRRAVYASLRRERGRAKITTSSSRRWRRWYVLSLRALRKLSGARDAQLRYVVNSVEALALARRLTPTRMPASFLQLERNRQYWRRLPYPASGDQVSFRGSQILFSTTPAAVSSCSRSRPSRRPTRCTASASAGRRSATGQPCAASSTR